MSWVLTESSSLGCGLAPHGGTMAPSGEAKLCVDGVKVLTVDDVKAASVANCAFMVGSSKHPCLSVASPTSGSAARLRINGVAVATAELKAPVNENPGVNVTASSAGQSKLGAV